jgi:deoxyribodipyrimidine photo-lyase
MKMNLVLFNKDLRVNDHQPLSEAVKLGEVLPLYIHEPSVWKGKELSARHFQFVIEGLEELSRQFTVRGGRLFFAIGEVETILDALLEAYGSLTIFAHKASRPVQKWVERNNQNYYVYGRESEKKSAKSLKKHWEAYMNEPIIGPPNTIDIPDLIPEVLFTELKKFHHVELKGSKIRFGQQGGELNAIETLDTFLEERFQHYMENSDKPIPSSLSSSRLSAYITWGNISERFIYQRTRERLERISGGNKEQLEYFLSKLYSREKILYETNANEKTVKTDSNKYYRNEEVFTRWLQGKTGIPFMDAAMRSLHKTGWLNFTLRGMVASFACNTLKLDCSKVSVELAGLFLDYQPEIHEYLMREQTAKGKLKLVNPIKMGKKLDPDGNLIKRYIPELSQLSNEFIHQPWVYPGFYQLGYETPVVDVEEANKRARLESETTLIKKKAVPAAPKEGDSEQLTFDL